MIRDRRKPTGRRLIDESTAQSSAVERGRLRFRATHGDVVARAALVVATRQPRKPVGLVTDQAMPSTDV